MLFRRTYLFPLSTIVYSLLAGILLITMPSKAYSISPESTTSKYTVVTIKPLYSLVTHLTDGILEPILLFKNNQTLHHYTMRPSERKLLAKADIIIWLGPELEPQLSKIIQQPKNRAKSISSLDAKNLNLLNKRSKHSHKEDNSISSTGLKQHRIDPHIWLSAQNAVQISKHICKSLITHDPQNSERYQQNLEKLLKKIKLAENAIEKNIAKNKQPFLVYHDAFQYFEDEYKLNYVDSISYDEETGSSLKHIQEIKSQIEEKDIRCLVYQPPRPGIIDTLIKQTHIKAFELDPLGLNVNDDKNAWFEIMQQISTNFSSCLNS